MILKERELRGVPNRSMVCSEKELGLSDSHEGILLLDWDEFGHFAPGTPLQDVLGLGSEARMNTPAKPSGNWAWRFRMEALQPEHKTRLRTLALTYGRKEPEVKKDMPSYM